MTWLPTGCAPPDPAELNTYWHHAVAELGELQLPNKFQVRWIGLDDATTEQVIELIQAGDKTGTFTLPWIIEHTGQPDPAVGDPLVLVDFRGHPRLLVRLTEIETVPFGAITTTHTRIDGSPVRDLAIWKPLHTNYWNNLLAPYQLSVDAAMPVLVEKFALLRAN